LVKKNQKWDWIEKQEKVFEKLKKRFIKELILTVLDLNKKIRMEVDILDYVIEGVRVTNLGLKFLLTFFFISNFIFNLFFYFESRIRDRVTL